MTQEDAVFGLTVNLDAHGAPHVFLILRADISPRWALDRMLAAIPNVQTVMTDQLTILAKAAEARWN